MKTFSKYVATVLGLLLLIGSSTVTAHANESTILDNQCLNLSEQNTTQILNQIKADIVQSYEGVYAFENYEVIIMEAKQSEVNYSINVDVVVDMILIRNPEQSPLILGMKEAADLIENPQEKELAYEVIDEYLREFMTYYNVPIQTGFSYQVQLSDGEKQAKSKLEGMQFFHRTETEEGDIMLTPVEESPEFTEIVDINDGAEILDTALNESLYRQVRAVSYSRSSAVTYAINHATDEPEFTADNYGSDCANFVSKCLNVGGIPSDNAGKWYPGASWGKLGGHHWYRTGFNGENGVIIYMKDKGYFSSCTSSQVNTGCIMYWNNTSHVALVTLCDGSTIKYSEHGSTKRSSVYYTYNSSTQSVTFYKSNI